MSEGFAEVNGARLWYEDTGSGPALVMLHGMLIDSGQWDEQMATLARSYRVVRYDARGFGRSDLPAEPFSFSEDLLGLMRRLGIERASLMGCSGGGATAIDLALSNPEAVNALVLVGSGLAGYRFFEGQEPPATVVEQVEARRRGDLERAVELGLQIWTDGERRRPDQVNPVARERTREMMARFMARPAVPGAEPRWVEPPAISRLAEVGAPTLAIVGGDDWAPIHEIAGLVESQVPGARKVVIPDAGHHPNMEHPELFDETVLGFLREASPD
jgi:pimeloyl-ACP methyl ester carboxylesterase